MRSVTRRALTLGAIAVTALGWSGCDARKQTEYVAGVSTQVTVPRDLKAIVINVSVGGVQQFCRPYTVYNGRVQLPRSLGEYAASKTPSAEPITVSVIGLGEDFTDSSQNPLFTSCEFSAGKVKENNVRILRRSRQPYIPEEVHFLPMPLKFSCFEKDCPDDRTCKAGRCESVDTDPKTLPLFTPDLVDGTGGACFSASECFAAAVPAVLVDPTDCTYALPNTPSAPPLAPGSPANPITSSGDGINVEITYDGGFTREIIDKEPVEGFTIPDPTKPQRFRLAPGLCDMVKGVDPDGKETPHRITAIRATGLCRAKGQFQPLCADDQLSAMGTPLGVAPASDPALQCESKELKSAKSALMILADDTENNAIFYTGGGGGAGGADIAKSDLVSAALSDPAFRNTYIGLTLFPGGAGAACSPHPVDVTPKLASQSRPEIVAKFAALKVAGALKPKDTELRMSGALDDAYTALKSGFADANRRAVLVIGNRGFDTNVCGAVGTPTTRAAAARTTDKIETYVALLARDPFIVPEPDPPPVVPGAQAVAEAGAPPGSGAHAFDARKDKNQAVDTLRKIVDDLATCAYDVATDPGNSAVLTYSDPVAIAGPQKTFYSINHDAACTTDGATANGWGYNASSKRVFVCGKACDDYRNTLRTAAGYAAQYGQPSLAVPLFSLKSAACLPK